MDGLVVLDLYAGTGALALEAISRGAARAILVENDARACAAIFHNVESLRYGERCRLLRAELPQALIRSGLLRSALCASRRADDAGWPQLQRPANAGRQGHRGDGSP